MPQRLRDKRWPWMLLAAAGLLGFLSVFFEVRIGETDTRPLGSAEDIGALRERTDVNVLFLLIDTLRADRLSAYGYARETSPVLDRLAESGVRFGRHLAQSSWTKASMASLWTGLYPVRTGVTRYDHVLPEDARLPAEILSEGGFRTAGIYRNGWVADTFGFDQGFDIYANPPAKRPPPAVRLANPTLGMEGSDADTIEGAIEFLRVHADQRWLLYLHLMDVHEYTYDRQSALFGNAYTDVYDNSIRRVDGLIGALLSHLEEGGLSSRTIVVIGSDHGEAFLERGLEGHARNVFRESTEVPLLIQLPFRLDPGVTLDLRTRNVDVWPTILDVLGFESPAGLDGRSMLPEILALARGEAPPEDLSTAVAHLDQTWGQPTNEPRPAVAVASGTLRYVRNVAPSGEVGERLFDAALDSRELRDRSKADPEALERMRAIADAHLEEAPVWGEAPTRELDELQLNMLRALGYALP